MKNKIFIGAFILLLMITTSSYAQFNPNNDNVKLVTAGFGFTNWGLPLFARYEQAVVDNITVGGSLSFQSKTGLYGNLLGNDSDWKNNIVILDGRGSYHFNELLNATDEWDFYAGASLGYTFWNTKYKGTGNSIYSNSGNGSFHIGSHVGARYFFSDKLGGNAETFYYTSRIVGVTIGITFLL